MELAMSRRYKNLFIMLKKCILKHKKITICIFVIMLIFFNSAKKWIDRRNAMLEMYEPIIVEFPLRGEWLSPNTPGTKVPSHGTNQLGTRYAYDFIQVDWNRIGTPAYRVGVMQYLFSGVKLSDYYCWGQEVYSPCDGIVVGAEDGYAENEKTNLLADMSNAYKNAHYFDPEKDDIQSVAGNYVIIKYSENVYAALCHLQTGSIQVSVGQMIKKGEVIGRVGHSGNSFAPHLHFQLMDSSDISVANGVPCAFEQYEIFRDNEWQIIENGIPTDKDRIRFW
ncbi:MULTISPECIES: M23 family metallopeptidase [Sporofaciens]|nr:M23 family metallopeptidase [Sporofaciens musculi]